MRYGVCLQAHRNTGIDNIIYRIEKLQKLGKSTGTVQESTNNVEEG